MLFTSKRKIIIVQNNYIISNLIFMVKYESLIFMVNIILIFMVNKH